MNEINAIENWIHDVMMTDSVFVGIVGNQWWKYEAKPSATGIYGVYNLQAASDVQGNKVRLLTRPLYWCRLIIKGFPTANFDIAVNRLDEVLGNVAIDIGTDSDGSTRFAISSERVQPLSYIERDTQTKDTFFHVGGLYRFEVSQLV